MTFDRNDGPYLQSVGQREYEFNQSIKIDCVYVYTKENFEDNI